MYHLLPQIGLWQQVTVEFWVKTNTLIPIGLLAVMSQERLPNVVSHD